MNDDLYQDLILERARRPSGLPAAADRRADLDNPFCGDHITVAVRLEDGRVAEIGYEGEGCALARASASMMTDAARGRTREEMSALFKRLQALIAGTPDPELARTIHAPTEHGASSVSTDEVGASSRRSEEGVGRRPITDERRLGPGRRQGSERSEPQSAPQIGRQATEAHELSGLGDLAAFAGVAGHPSRRRCVTLAWEALLEALRP